MLNQKTIIMKILKTILISCVLYNLTISCTPEEIVEKSKIDTISNIKDTGGDGVDVDQTKKWLIIKR